jgi:thiol-disulfide isomerase/thioredoxin
MSFFRSGSCTIALLPLALLLSTQGATASDPLDGQIVCSQCWFEAERPAVPYPGPDDLACARRCNDAGVPPALAVQDPESASFELLLLPDPPPGGGSWLELIGRYVRAKGRLETRDATKYLTVESLDMLEDSPWQGAAAVAEPPARLVWTDLAGYELSLEDLRGRVVVLNFWATWCAPCVAELKDLVKLQNEYGVLGVQVLGAGADAPDQAAAVLAFSQARRVNFPVGLGASTAQMRSLGLGATLPATVVLDRSGNVVERFDGVFERAALEQAIERALDSDPEHDHAADVEHGPDPARATDHTGVHLASAAASGASLVPS